MSIETPMLGRFERIDNLGDMRTALQTAKMEPGRQVSLFEGGEEIPYEDLLSKVLSLTFQSIPLAATGDLEARQRLCIDAQEVNRKMDDLSCKLDRSMWEVLKDTCSTMWCCGCYCPCGNRACKEESLHTLISKIFTLSEEVKE